MIRINLLPTKAERRKESVYVQLGFGAVIIVVALGIAFYLKSQAAGRVEEEKTKIADLNAQLKQLEAIVKEVNDFKAKKRDLNKKIDTIRSLNDNRSGPVRLLEEFTYVIPLKSWVSTFREDKLQLTLEGIALDGGTVADLVDNLRGSKYFHSVQLIQSTQQVVEGKKMQRYSVSCRVYYVPPGGGA